jgi:hypothetical protein
MIYLILVINLGLTVVSNFCIIVLIQVISFISNCLILILVLILLTVTTWHILIIIIFLSLIFLPIKLLTELTQLRANTHTGKIMLPTKLLIQTNKQISSIYFLIPILCIKLDSLILQILKIHFLLTIQVQFKRICIVNNIHHQPLRPTSIKLLANFGKHRIKHKLNILLVKIAEFICFI